MLTKSTLLLEGVSVVQRCRTSNVSRAHRGTKAATGGKGNLNPLSQARNMRRVEQLQAPHNCVPIILGPYLSIGHPPNLQVAENPKAYNGHVSIGTCAMT
eukprot:580593-Pelagomonas_calceolata.AAC.1